MIKITIAILLLNVMSCGAQEIKENVIIKNKGAMEHFNIKTFLDNNPNGNQKNFISDGKKIQQFKISQHKKEGFVEVVKNVLNPISVYKEFYETCSLKKRGELFYSFHTGVWKEYSENGTPAKEIDYDKPYKFSVADLTKKMKEEYKIDIMNLKRMNKVHRWIDTKNTKLPLYEVYAKDETIDLKLNCYMIDGNTGEVLFSDTRFMESEGEEESLYTAFLKHYQQEKHVPAGSINNPQGHNNKGGGKKGFWSSLLD